MGLSKPLKKSLSFLVRVSLAEHHFSLLVTVGLVESRVAYFTTSQ